MNTRILTLLGILFCCNLTQAATYYVAPPASGGSDSNPGSLASPHATIQRVTVTDSATPTKRCARVRVTTS